jgi:hypothetical protein
MNVKSAFYWFLLHSYITVRSSENVKYAFLRGNRTLYPFNGSLCGSQSWIEHFGVGKNHLRLP